MLTKHDKNISLVKECLKGHCVDCFENGFRNRVAQLEDGRDVLVKKPGRRERPHLAVGETAFVFHVTRLPIPRTVDKSTFVEWASAFVLRDGHSESATVVVWNVRNGWGSGHVCLADGYNAYIQSNAFDSPGCLTVAMKLVVTVALSADFRRDSARWRAEKVLALKMALRFRMPKVGPDRSRLVL